ncbi:acyl-CoA dehydrogenase family protein, partial [Staphylococcus pasteuri_A]|nr:acyl-CoA dehydrogenase family protein [Staphylococcus pasteuri_A]
MMVGLAEERLTGAVSYVARAERSFEITLEYVKDRNAFGRPIGAFQNTRFKMAEMRTQLDVAW